MMRQSKTKKHERKSARRRRVVMLTMIRASITFLRSSWEITSSTSHREYAWAMANPLVSNCCFATVSFTHLIDFMCSPDSPVFNFGWVNSIDEARIRGAGSPHLRSLLNLKLFWYLDPYNWNISKRGLTRILPFGLKRNCVRRLLNSFSWSGLYGIGWSADLMFVFTYCLNSVYHAFTDFITLWLSSNWSINSSSIGSFSARFVSPR